jgi:hypothetical protein
MRIEELTRAMLRIFTILVTIVTLGMYVFCIVFNPNTNITPADIGGILLMALVIDLTFFIFLSRKELSKKQMIFRVVVHIPILFAVLLYFVHLWNWVDIRDPIEVIFFLLFVLGGYALVLTVTAYQDKKTADKLNAVLKKRYRS